MLIFQPAEEGPGGALPMIEAGVLDDPRVDAIAMIHVDSRLDAGAIGIYAGGRECGGRRILPDIRGSGGHGGYPHTAVDAIPAAAAMVLALQNVVARETDPLASAVLTVGTIAGGYRNNVIADEVKLSGTLRSHDDTVRDELEARLRRIVGGVAAAYNVRADVRIVRGYPPVHNDAALAQEFGSYVQERKLAESRTAAGDDGRRRFCIFRATRAGRIDSPRRAKRGLRGRASGP